VAVVMSKGGRRHSPPNSSINLLHPFTPSIYPSIDPSLKSFTSNNNNNDNNDNNK